MKDMGAVAAITTESRPENSAFIRVTPAQKLATVCSIPLGLPVEPEV